MRGRPIRDPVGTWREARGELARLERLSAGTYDRTNVIGGPRRLLDRFDESQAGLAIELNEIRDSASRFRNALLLANRLFQNAAQAKPRPVNEKLIRQLTNPRLPPKGTLLCADCNTADFTGVYDTTLREMVFSQSGTVVTDCYDWEGGTLSGTVQGKILSGTWRELPAQGVVETDRDRGGFIFELMDTGFNGVWNYDRDGGLAALKIGGGSEWIGRRTEPADQPACTPP